MKIIAAGMGLVGIDQAIRNLPANEPLVLGLTMDHALSHQEVLSLEKILHQNGIQLTAPVEVNNNEIVMRFIRPSYKGVGWIQLGALLAATLIGLVVTWKVASEASKTKNLLLISGFVLAGVLGVTWIKKRSAASGV